ncbi:MAG: hypothetical protein WKF75_04995 [Singulisphaera sp.]
MPEHTFLGGEPTIFKNAYPKIESLRIEVFQHGDMEWEHQKHQLFSEANVPAEIPCGNGHCRQGGFSMRCLIDYMVYGNKTDHEDTMHCRGHEGSPKGRRKGDPCMNYIKVKITLRPKE